MNCIKRERDVSSSCDSSTRPSRTLFFDGRGWCRRDCTLPGPSRVCVPPRRSARRLRQEENDQQYGGDGPSGCAGDPDLSGVKRGVGRK